MFKQTCLLPAPIVLLNMAGYWVTMHADDQLICAKVVCADQLVIRMHKVANRGEAAIMRS
jgi:hypothetical protein